MDRFRGLLPRWIIVGLIGGRNYIRRQKSAESSCLLLFRTEVTKYLHKYVHGQVYWVSQGLFGIGKTFRLTLPPPGDWASGRRKRGRHRNMLDSISLMLVYPLTLATKSAINLSSWTWISVVRHPTRDPPHCQWNYDRDSIIMTLNSSVLVLSIWCSSMLSNNNIGCTFTWSHLVPLSPRRLCSSRATFVTLRSCCFPPAPDESST